MVRHLARKPFNYFFRMFLFTPVLPSNNISPWVLGVILVVVDAYYCYVVDIWVFEEFAFEFCRGDLNHPLVRAVNTEDSKYRKGVRGRE
jgi:hypothetical protein